MFSVESPSLIDSSIINTPLIILSKIGKSVYAWRCLRCGKIEVSEIRRFTLGFGAITEERRRVLLKPNVEDIRALWHWVDHLALGSTLGETSFQ
jgi:hypothetical protein